MKKLTFLRALKNIIGCLFCSIKDCPVRYNSERQKATLSYKGDLFGQKCKKEKTLQERWELISKELDEE